MTDERNVAVQAGSIVEDLAASAEAGIETPADDGVSLVLVPSAWPYPRVEHWQALPKSRAIENLTYVAAVNSAGEMGGDRLVGRSTVYDPWGTPVATCDEDPALMTAEVLPSRVTAVREEFPALGDRRRPE